MGIKQNGSKRGYTFKRNFYYEIEAAIDKASIVFLLGPRKCGKTVALLQLEKNRTNVAYYNFKTLTQNKSLEIFDIIKSSMEKDEERIFLLDEITYAYQPEKEINDISIQLSEKQCYNTKIVFTGSQSMALEAWANRAFCGNASIIRTDFLTYSEWLSYKGIKETSEIVYHQFLYEIDEFYGFLSLENYLRGCLEETIIANQKTDNVIIGNDVYLIDVDALLDICYATLFTLHNYVNGHGCVKSDKLNETIQFYFRDVCKQIGSDEIGERIAKSFIGKYNDFKARDLDTLKQSFQFLHRIGLLTITPVSDDIENIPNVYRDLSFSASRINYKEELFKSYNICIKYPMFYMAILKDILKEKLPQQLPPALLGSIVECHVRGLLSDKGAFEFRDALGHEVDYVNVMNCVALEITISNKRSNEISFKYLPEDYQKIILTKNIREVCGNQIKIPYHEFIGCIT